ncbi:MAG: ComF family protein [Desulfobulbus sp.]|nr:ComF family protein [Desulfobulbus sp.]
MLSSLLGAIQDLLFPPLCVGCSRRLDHSRPPLFCADCTVKLAFITAPLCPCCGIPYTTGADHLCATCLRNGYEFDLARSLLFYQMPVDALILGLKFGGQLNGLQTLGTLASGSPCFSDLARPDYIIPVPLHPQRIRERGYNQATLIARECFPQWKAQIRLNILYRNRLTTPQSQLTGKERRANLKQVFSLNPTVALEGKTILLVDDVQTTGSTVNECAKTLRRGGAGRIEVFTVARSLGKSAW